MAIRRAQLEKCQLCRVHGHKDECELCGGTGYVIMPKDDDD